jgi:hypothetical protein
MELRATRRLAAEDSASVITDNSNAGELEGAWDMESLDYRRARGGVQPGDAEGVRLPSGIVKAGGLH